MPNADEIKMLARDIEEAPSEVLDDIRDAIRNDKITLSDQVKDQMAKHGLRQDDVLGMILKAIGRQDS